MTKFNAVEFSFRLPDFGVISVHLLVGIGPIVVDLVDDQSGVTIDH